MGWTKAFFDISTVRLGRAREVGKVKVKYAKSLYQITNKKKQPINDLNDFFI